MRLDKYLKVSRLIKRRTVANEACDKGRVSVNGRPAKAGHEVKENDIIEMSIASYNIKVKVTNIKEHTRKEEAKEMYQIL
jgi:ribosomal 50S subunit-recycling heat shock protein